MSAAVALPGSVRAAGTVLRTSRSLRVALCTAGEIWGGVEQCVLTLTVALRQRGVDTRAILFYDGPLASRLRGAGVTVHIVATTSPYGRAQLSDVREVIRRHGVTLAHTHGYRATIVVAAARPRGSGLAIVKTEHGVLEPPSSWRQVPSYARLAANIAIDRAVSRFWVDRVAYVSQDIRRLTARWCGDGPVIYNGILPEDAVRQAGEAQARVSGVFTIGIVGRLTAVKGHDFLLRALAGTPDTVRLRIFGTGPDEARLRDRVRQLGLIDRVEFAGFVSPIQPALASLDLLVMPSLHEGLPYALLEAMSLGVPVVASRVGGLTEALEDGISGVLVPPRSPGALADAIVALQRSPSRRLTLAHRAREVVRGRFHVDQMVDRYLETYMSVFAVGARAGAGGGVPEGVSEGLR